MNTSRAGRMAGLELRLVQVLVLVLGVGAWQ